MSAPNSIWLFEGPWRIAREIDDRGGQGAGAFHGTAHLRRSGAMLICEEEGTFTMTGGGAFRATRRYLWREENGWLAVSFDDGRPFHAIPLGIDEPEATHLCDPDRYEVAYDFRAWPEWTQSWTVTGPRKDYSLTSRFTRPG